MRRILALGAFGALLLSLALVLSPWPWATPIPPGLLLLYLFVTAEVADVPTPRS